MRIVLSRKMSFHLWQTYIPSSIFVIASWLSVFVPPDQVPGNFKLHTYLFFYLLFLFDPILCQYWQFRTKRNTEKLVLPRI